MIIRVYCICCSCENIIRVFGIFDWFITRRNIANGCVYPIIQYRAEYGESHTLLHSLVSSLFGSHETSYISRLETALTLWTTAHVHHILEMHQMIWWASAMVQNTPHHDSGSLSELSFPYGIIVCKGTTVISIVFIGPLSNTCIKM